MKGNFAIGVTAGYGGHASDWDVTIAMQAIHIAFPKAVIKEGRAIYPRAFGCPEGGEVILDVDVEGDKVDIIECVKNLMLALRQSTVTVIFESGSAVYLSNGGETMVEFPLDAFESYTELHAEELQKRTEEQLEKGGIVTTGVLVGTTYKSVRNPAFCTDSVAFHVAIKELLATSKKYYVTYKIDARYIAEVEATSLDEAMEKASEKWIEADFGEASDIDGEPIMVEDESGNYLYEK